ncbi:DUF2924 domain-containing protein [Sphingomonas rhizophila]|uniref:DUF2924 domain-containing protein n=1 Tax=Sphingomonas rhizophila TaxID=2071607 RepID=A0A7G9SBK2_9SPHN|nr:DUF2924 domain-containing protein [Sphingomonas rhizophila]QNN65227.1 DUF2924 domain-containing protein [Sphingomonas rhizophila]
MSTLLQEEVAAVEQLDLHQLRAEWERRFGPAPRFRSETLLRLMLAWRMQAAVHGGLDGETRAALRRRGAVEAEGKHLGVGATLRREWQGEEVEVTVTPGGFRWRDREFKSLSAAATAIAGSKWNGPRFFGLRP